MAGLGGGETPVLASKTLVAPTRLELVTFGLLDQCSNQLSYGAERVPEGDEGWTIRISVPGHSETPFFDPSKFSTSRPHPTAPAPGQALWAAGEPRVVQAGGRGAERRRRPRRRTARSGANGDGPPSPHPRGGWGAMQHGDSCLMSPQPVNGHCLCKRHSHSHVSCLPSPLTGIASVTLQLQLPPATHPSPPPTLSS